MKIRLIAIGKFKQSPERALFEHYNARLRPKIELIEIVEPKKMDAKQRQLKEGEALLDKCHPNAPIIALDEHGKNYDSVGFAKLLEGHACPDLNMLIGGADGLHALVKERSTCLFALGKVTWPHLLVRGLIAEQIYRAQTILANHPYHRI